MLEKTTFRYRSRDISPACPVIVRGVRLVSFVASFLLRKAFFMNRLQTTFLGVLAMAATVGVATPAQAQVAYATNNGGTQLIRFDNIASPTSFTTVGTFSGSVSGILGLDFRPSNGVLYGYGSNNTIVTIDLATASTTFVSTVATPSSTVDLGIDFNPVPDRLRVVNPVEQNLRINVDNGGTTSDNPFLYAAGDVNAGADPTLNEVAYTNSIGPSPRTPPPGTTIYYLDYGTNSLTTAALPNGNGVNTVLTTVGTGLGIGDFSSNTGFDIFTPVINTNAAFALLEVGGVASIYSIDLTSGLATTLGTPTGLVNARGLAIAGVPEPSSVAVAGIFATGLVGLVVRRRRRAL